MRKKESMAVKISYFVVSMIVIGMAYMYTDDIMAWVFGMMMDSVNGSLEQVLR